MKYEYPDGFSYEKFKEDSRVNESDIDLFMDDDEILSVMRGYTGYDYKFHKMHEPDRIAAISIAGMVEKLGVDESVRVLKSTIPKRMQAWTRAICRARNYKRME